MPGKNATGTNTAISTSAVAMTAPSTSPIASDAASSGVRLYSWMWRWMFSMTTIASSTTMPVASVMPKSVSVLIEKPSSLTNAKVPTSETGIVMVGMIVLRQSCRNRNMTSTTSAIASSSVLSTSRIESETTVVVSKAILILERPAGTTASTSRSSSAVTWLYDVERVRRRQLATPKPTASRPLKRRSLG